MELIKVSPNKEKAKSMLKMVKKTLEMTKGLNKKRFPSNIIKEYYESIRELMSIILLLEGYKTIGEKAHKGTIEYIEENYKELSSYEISLTNSLRIIRNKIAYDGFFVKEDYLKRNLKNINQIILKLEKIIKSKL